MKNKILKIVVLSFTIIILLSTLIYSQQVKTEYLKGAYRYEKNGWIFIHLEGEPFQIGYQHGYLLSKEIAQTIQNIKYYLENIVGKPWSYFRNVVEKIHEVKTPLEYKQEMKGISAALNDKGYKEFDYLDIVAINNWLQIAWYYIPWEEQKLEKKSYMFQEKCSAFIATGNATFDGRIVMAHNSWLDYIVSQYWNIIVDLNPVNGHRTMAQTFPGCIHSGPDWIMNDNGIMVTETTMIGFYGFDPDGIPESVRLRKATQYANSIDEWINIMLEGNNGEYANDWLIGDRKTGEIARLELGLKHYKVWRTFDGYFVGSNIARDKDVRKFETTFDYSDPSSTSYARWARWQQLMKQYYGTIDTELAKRFLADHFDTFGEKYRPGSTSICGHIEDDPKGMPAFGPGPYYPSGAFDAKTMDSINNIRWEFWVKWGHPCGTDFIADKFLKKHPEYSIQKPQLNDIISKPWTLIAPKK